MNIKKSNGLFFTCIIALLFCATLLNSTTMIMLSLKEMCTKSNHIITARTISFDSYFIKDQKRIYTDIQLEVVDKIKGQFKEKDTFKITLFGGAVNGVTTIAIGSPTFKIGEESLLFISEKHSFRSGQNYFNIIGLSQGKFNIFTDNKTNEKKIVRDQIEPPLKLEKDGPTLPLTNSQSITLESLLNNIQTYIK